MDSERDGKRKEKHRDDDDYRREKRSRRDRSHSRSPKDKRDREPRRKREGSRLKSHVVAPKREKVEYNKKPDFDVKREAPERKIKETDMLNTRTGGAYIPPARLRMMQAQITDKSSVAYQRLAWEALKKSIHGHINKINVGNIGIIIKQLLRENIVRGRGLLSRSVIQAQAASPTFTNVYAALVAAVNSRFPNIGELLLKRLVIQFKRGFKRNDKPICISSASFIAHLVNQRVAHEILALELLTLLVETPTDDSVEVAIAFLKECGQKLTEVSSKGVNAIFEMLRNILHEGQVDKRVQYMIEVMFQVWKDGFKDHPALIEELELVPEEEQFTHLLMLDDATDAQDILNVFKFDDKYEENEQKYKGLSNEILGSDAESDGDGEGSGSESGDEESDDENQEQEGNKAMTIIDNTETNLVALRRTIYLTINSSLDFEECAHKLMKMQLKPGQEIELCHMFLDCCAEQRTYEKFYGLLAQRFCNINRIYVGPFEEIFKDSYGTAHRLDTNRLRNVSKFFAHLLFTDAISWEVLECVKLNEEDTTSSSRIYIKILFQELAEYMGLKKLNDRLKDQTLQGAFAGIFPRDNPKNTRFSINFFTSIGLGGLTDELREHLKQLPKNVPPPITDINVESGSSSSSDSSSSGSSSSSSDSDTSSSDSSSGSESENENKSKKKSNKDKEKEKSNKSKNTKKDKTSKVIKPNEENKDKDEKENDRWGHDGFYETYGKDARRNEPDMDRRKKEFPQTNSISRDKNRNNEHRSIEETDRHTGRRENEREYVDRRKNDDDRRNREESRRNDERHRDDRGNDREGRQDDSKDERRNNHREDKRGYDDRRRDDDRRNNDTEDRQDDRKKYDREYKRRDDDREDRRDVSRDERRNNNREDKRRHDDRRRDDDSEDKRDNGRDERRNNDREDKRRHDDRRRDDDSEDKRDDGRDERRNIDKENRRRHDDRQRDDDREDKRDDGRDDRRNNDKVDKRRYDIREEKQDVNRDERKNNDREDKRRHDDKRRDDDREDRQDVSRDERRNNDKESKRRNDNKGNKDSGRDDDKNVKHKDKDETKREKRNEKSKLIEANEDKDDDDWDTTPKGQPEVTEDVITTRYWDNFDIDKAKSKEYIEDRNSKRSEKETSRRRDR